MAEIKWIKLDADIFSNRKILQIESLPDGDAIIVIWLKLLTLAGNINDNGMIYFTQEIPYTDQMLSSQFRRPLSTVQMAMKVFEEFGMIEIVDDILHISNWEKYQNVEQMAVIREQNRVRQKRWYDSHKAISEKPNVRSNVSITLPNATDIDIEEDKKRKEKEKKNTSYSKKENLENLEKILSECTEYEKIKNSQVLHNSLREWMEYKNLPGKTKTVYQELSMKKLLSTIIKRADENGEEYVKSAIDNSIQNTWKGIAWDSVKPKSTFSVGSSLKPMTEEERRKWCES